MKKLVFGMVLAAASTAVQTAQAADDLTIPKDTEVAYGAETVDVGNIIFTAGGTAKAPYKGWLTLNGTTMTATGLVTPPGGSSNQWLYDLITATNGASLAFTTTSKITAFATTYGTQSGEILVKDDSSLSFAGAVELGCGTYHMKDVHTQLDFENATFTGKSVTLYGRSAMTATDSAIQVGGNLSTGARTGNGWTSGESLMGATGFTNRFSFVRSDTAISGGVTVAQYIQTFFDIVGGTFAVGGNMSLMDSTYSTPQSFPCAALTISGGADVSVTGTVNIANAANLHADVSLSSDSSLYAGALVVGKNGIGTLVAPGATVTSAGAVTIGSGSGSTGLFDLGAGTLAAASLTVGGNGAGTLNAKGATVTLSGALTVGAAGVLDLGGGTLSVGSLTGNAGTSTLKLDGATIRFVSDGAIFTGITTVESTAKTVTVDVNGHTVTLGQAPAGCKLHFTGKGTVVIPSGVTPTDYTFDRTVKFNWTDRGPTTTITQTEGTVTDTDAHTVAGNETLRFDIASGASRTASGVLGIGSLEKVGGGYLKLTNEKDYFSDVTLGGGTLALSSDMQEDTMAVFAISNKANLVVVENDAKQVATFPPKDNFKYAFLKRGAGELVLEKAVTAYDYNYTPSAPIVQSSHFDKTKPLDFSDPSVLPTENFMPLDVAEGKLTIRGTSEGQTRLAFLASVAVGVPVTTCAAQPEMVLENVSFEMSGQNYFHVGPANVAGSSAVVSPRLTVVNSTLYPHTLAVNDCYGRGSNKDQCSHVYFTNSTLKTSWNIMPNGAYYSGGSAFSELQFVDSAAHSSNVTLTDPFRMVFDHSVLDGWNAASIKFIAYENSTNLMVFANGSKFYFDGVNYDLTNSGNLTKRNEWVFDDSEWILNKTDSDRTYHVDDRVNVVCVMRGRGLVVKPGSGFTYTVNEPLTGDGGFVNAGAGTAVLKNGMVGYTGVTRAEQVTGVVDFDGATIENSQISGAGTFKNGTFVNANVPLKVVDGVAADAPVLDYANGLALTGNVTFDFGDSVIEKTGGVYPTITVATYTGGTAPDVSGWKLKRTETLRGGKFAAAGGVITCTPRGKRGLMFVIR